LRELGLDFSQAGKERKEHTQVEETAETTAAPPWPWEKPPDLSARQSQLFDTLKERGLALDRRVTTATQRDVGDAWDVDWRTVSSALIGLRRRLNILAVSPAPQFPDRLLAGAVAPEPVAINAIPAADPEPITNCVMRNADVAEPAAGESLEVARAPVTLPEAVPIEFEVEEWDAPARPRVVCLCGSTKFKPAFIQANYQETMAGRIVLSVGWFSHADAQVYYPTPEEKLRLDALHCQKIDLADEVLVLDVGGYTGESTRNEIAHATRTGKPIRYLSQEQPDYEMPADPAAGLAEELRQRTHERDILAGTRDQLTEKASALQGSLLNSEQRIRDLVAERQRHDADREGLARKLQEARDERDALKVGAPLAEHDAALLEEINAALGAAGCLGERMPEAIRDLADTRDRVSRCAAQYHTVLLACWELVSPGEEPDRRCLLELPIHLKAALDRLEGGADEGVLKKLAARQADAEARFHEAAAWQVAEIERLRAELVARPGPVLNPAAAAPGFRSTLEEVGLRERRMGLRLASYVLNSAKIEFSLEPFSAPERVQILAVALSLTALLVHTPEGSTDGS